MKFEKEHVISEYGDEQAVEDGFLVAVSKRDRVTNTVFALFEHGVPLEAAPPSRCPVALLRWCGAKNTATRAVLMCAGLIEQWRDRAHEEDRKDDRRIFSGFVLHTEDDPAQIRGFLPGIPHDLFPEKCTSAKVWFCPNELGGVTMMYPSDY